MGLFDSIKDSLKSEKKSPAEREQRLWGELNVLKAKKEKAERHLTETAAQYARGELSVDKYNALRRDIEASISDFDNKVSQQIQLISRQASEGGGTKEGYGAAIEFADMRAKMKERDDEIRKLRDQVEQYKVYIARIEGEGGEGLKGELAAAQRENSILKVILERYSAQVNEGEAKTVGEIRAMVDPRDLTVDSLTKRFTENKTQYDFTADYEEAARKAYAYVKDEIVNVKRSVNIAFWLYPSDVVKVGGGDNEDKSILLCSILRALGDENAYIRVVQLTNGLTHAFVMTQLRGKVVLLDTTTAELFDKYSATEQEVLFNFVYEANKISKTLYRFNDKFYEEEPQA